MTKNSPGSTRPAPPPLNYRRGGAPGALGRLLGLLKGMFAIYCVVSCSCLLVLIYVVLITPFLLINRSFERQLQQMVQWAWVYLLLGVTASAADSELLLTLPDDEEQEEMLLQKLKRGFEFIGVSSTAEQRPEGAPRDPMRDIVIGNHQIYMDWIYIWALMARLRREGDVKIILKRSLLKIPVFGLVRGATYSPPPARN